MASLSNDSSILVAPRTHDAMVADHRSHLGLPVTDPLSTPADEVVDMVLLAFPELAPATHASATAG